MNPTLITLSGPTGPVNDSEFLALDDLNAGIVFLAHVAKLYPGITWGQLPALAAQAASGRESMSGWFTDLGHAVGSVTRSAGSVIKDAIGVTGDVAGSAIRLVTDQKVLSGVTQIAGAVATDGGSVAAQGISGDLMDFVKNLGGSFKSMISSGGDAPGQNQASMFGSAKMLPWVLAGGAVLFVLFARRAPVAVGR